MLTAVQALLHDEGPALPTMEAIARRAGISKRTLYRWWPSRADVVLESLLEQVDAHGVYPDSGDLATDLKTQLRSVTALVADTVVGDTIRTLIADAQGDPAVARSFRDRYLLPRRAAARAMLGRAVKRGELDKAVDLEVAVDMLYAPTYLRLLTGHAPLSDDFADHVVDACLHGLRPQN